MWICLLNFRIKKTQWMTMYVDKEIAHQSKIHWNRKISSYLWWAKNCKNSIGRRHRWQSSAFNTDVVAVNLLKPFLIYHLHCLPFSLRVRLLMSALHGRIKLYSKFPSSSKVVLLWVLVSSTSKISCGRIRYLWFNFCLHQNQLVS